VQQPRFRAKKVSSSDAAIAGLDVFMSMLALAWLKEQVLWCLLDSSPASFVVYIVINALVTVLLVNMPSTLSSSPFLSLKPDQDCGRSSVQSPREHSGGKHLQNGNGTNGVNGHHEEDDFLRLSSPQQDLLLLHGPRQKYVLEKARDIPELTRDDEILVQVLAIGLNPVDWKGADYGFSQPS
jgi:hypothetical protein